MCDTCGSIVAKGLGVDKMTPEIKIRIATNGYQKMILRLIPAKKDVTESFTKRFESFRQMHEINETEHLTAIEQAIQKLADQKLIIFNRVGTDKYKIHLTAQGSVKKNGLIGKLQSMFFKK